MSSKPHPTLRYTASRFGVFVASFALVWLLAYVNAIPLGRNNSNVVWMILLALVISAPVSLVLLRKQRDAMSEQLVVKVDRAKSRLSANQGREDGV